MVLYLTDEKARIVKRALLAKLPYIDDEVRHHYHDIIEEIEIHELRRGQDA